MTNNRGEDWTSTEPLLSNEHANITALEWISTNRLLIGADDSSVQLFELDVRTLKLKRLWEKTPNPHQGGVYQFSLDADGAWVGKSRLMRFRFDNGETDATIDFALGGRRMMAVCRHILVLGDRKKAGTILNWSPKEGAVYTPGPDLSTGEVGGVLPLESPKCLVLTEAGAGQVVDLNSGDVAPTLLQVDWRAPESDPNRPTREEFSSMMQLARKIPHERCDAIFAEANQKTDWTPKKRVEWVTDRLTQALSDQGGPKKIPPEK